MHLSSEDKTKNHKEHAALLLTFSRESRIDARYSVHDPLLTVKPKASLKRKHSEIGTAAIQNRKPGNILAPEVPFLVPLPRPKGKANSKATPKVEHKFLPVDSILGCRYKIVETRGFGGYGCVYACRDLTSSTTKQMVAVKVFKPSELFRLSARNEVCALSMFKNIPGIVQLLDQFEYEKQSCVVMELCDTSLLCKLTTEFKTGFPLFQVRTYGKQILQAVSLLHSQGIVHSDLKPDNLGLTGETVKLLDFGSCKRLSKAYLYAQTLRYRAPEVLMKLPSSSQIDMWAIGCTLVELYTGKCLFRSDFLSVDEKKKNSDQLIKITKTLGPLPLPMVEKSKLAMDALDEKALQPLQLGDPIFQDLILGLLQYDPLKRLTAKQALEHPFFLSLL